MITEARARRLSAGSRFAVRFIETYRARVAPGLPSRCRFTPTCSEYGLEAYWRHGFFRATAMTLWRLARCNPMTRPGTIDRH